MATAAVILTTGVSSDGQPWPRDPFGFLAPVVVISDADRRRLDRDEVLAKTLPAMNGQIALFVATRLTAPPDALVAWTRAIAELKRSKFVRQVRRFSEPPSVADLDTLVLDDRDLNAIRQCAPGDCGLKLSAAEIESLSQAIAGAGSAWRDVAQREFRQVIVRRVNAYVLSGLAGLAPLADRRRPYRPADALAALVDQSPYLARFPNVNEWLQRPQGDSVVESFFYWSKEHYGDGKPVISVTHVGIVRPESDGHLPSVLVVGKQVFASHYLEGALGLTMVVHDDHKDALYLAYLNRSQLDLLKGFFGPLARGVLEGRVAREAPRVMGDFRSRLEADVPRDRPFGGSRSTLPR
jgi:hypothetical protein